MSEAVSQAALRADSLDPTTHDAVAALVEAATVADGTPPLSEDARLALGAGPRLGRHHLLLRRAGELVGYAQVTVRSGGEPVAELELVIAPHRRGTGLGTALLAAAVEAARGSEPSEPTLLAWSHGDSPAASALAARGGWRRARELWQMSCDLTTPLPPLAVPDGVRLRPFEDGRDEQAWLGLNARAFAAHPEQGRWTIDDLRARQREPWYSASDLLLAQDSSGAVVASHWMKVERSAGQAGAGHGEVYVVAVDPGAQGRGLGGVVVLAGLHHLVGQGVRVASLYVEGDNAPARHLYERLGFTRTGIDVQYAHAPPR